MRCDLSLFAVRDEECCHSRLAKSIETLIARREIPGILNNPETRDITGACPGSIAAQY